MYYTLGLHPNDPEWFKITRFYPEMCLNGVNTQWVYSQGNTNTLRHMMRGGASKKRCQLLLGKKAVGGIPSSQMQPCLVHGRPAQLGVSQNDPLGEEKQPQRQGHPGSSNLGSPWLASKQQARTLRKTCHASGSKHFANCFTGSSGLDKLARYGMSGTLQNRKKEASQRRSVKTNSHNEIILCNIQRPCKFCSCSLDSALPPPPPRISSSKELATTPSESETVAAGRHLLVLTKE